ncbi:hypothetical protein [Nonomuraea polychroma]|uniref:hypothetical protein n=1 Tax=Nonomuraea polychroma TaxID=46176 RepID=UPI0013E2CBCB|nr:hypothetical protein [Nonomuraea polychroma]
MTLLSGWSQGTLEPAVTASDLAWTYAQPTGLMANAHGAAAADVRAVGRRARRGVQARRKNKTLRAIGAGAVMQT